jgi:hypothetical protein
MHRTASLGKRMLGLTYNTKKPAGCWLRLTCYTTAAKGMARAL